jgi:hypothetical protein
MSPVNKRAPKLITNALILTLGVAILLIEIICRVVSVFIIDKPRGGGQPMGPGTPVGHMQYWVFRNYPFYMFQGGTEWLVPLMLLITRADLRFYIPDKSNVPASEVYFEQDVDFSGDSSENAKASVVHVENV